MYAAAHLASPLPDLTREELLTRLSAVAGDMTPRWERIGPQALLLDVSGLQRILGGPDEIAAAVRTLGRERELPLHVAIAPTWMAALALAGAGIEAIVPAGGAATALGPLPIEALAVLPGVDLVLDGPARVRRLGGAGNYRLSAGLGLVSGPAGTPAGTSSSTSVDDGEDPVPVRMPPGRPWPDLLATFQRWGITTCAALARLPRADLQARMGDRGCWLQGLAFGADPRPLRTQPPDEDFAQAMDLEWPIEGLEPLSFVLGRVLDPLCAQLEARDRAAAIVRLTLHLTDRQVHERAIELPVPVREARVLRTLLLLDLEAHPPHAAIDRVRVAVDPVPGRVLQFSLLRKALPSDDQLAALLARLTALMGEGRCGAPALIDSHRPGDVAMMPFVPSGTDGADGGVATLLSALGLTATRDAGRARGDEREPAREGWLDTAGYHVRRLRQPWPIEVVLGRARTPRSVRFGVRVRDTAFRDGTVVQAAGPWRSSGAWWQSATDRDGAWDRDEWDIALDSGAAYRVFQDRQSGQWWVEGEID
jgi:protein ImuB